MASSSTRLGFFLIFFFFFTFLSNNGVVDGSHKIFKDYQFRVSKKVLEEHRTRFHFQPVKHWMNDPNGPMYYNGIYHLFYQYNPYGAVWGNIVWAHSVSTDLINWIPLDPAIVPSKPFDINGCWSGSATILPGDKPVILYTGIDTEKRQVQNIAIPKNLSDPLLVEWIKPDYNPVIVPSLDVNVSSFRDPTTAWLGPDGRWRVLVGNKRRTRGMALLYRSRDFVHWTKAKHPLHSSPNLGMWECPDFFPVSLNGEEGVEVSAIRDDVKHVLKVSLDARRFEYYTIGQYFHEKDRYIPENSSVDNASGLRYDYGNFYASKTFFDARLKRRILWGWANESDPVADDNKKGWAGIQLIPRSLWLDEGGKQLKQWPIKEVETLRRNQIRMNDVSIRKGGVVEIKGITAAQADVKVTFHLPSLSSIHLEPFDPNWKDPELLCGLKSSTDQGSLGPFGLLTLASKNLEEFTAVFFRVFDAKPKPVVLMCSGGIKSSIGEEMYKPSFGGFVDVDLSDRQISLRTLIDHSVVESFGEGGKTCITSRVYPKLALKSAARLYAFNNGTQTVKVKHLKAWSMDSPRMN